jgi:hypothetical protein
MNKNTKTAVIAGVVGLVVGYIASDKLKNVPVINKLPKL